ncbi:hypothetical protein Q5P01_018381 [Channa striata]|uniref:Uncharacterized protein n=1 Tax=Channa striata TaxID=64152 RepID=A0AA88S839_CHASR|nr:hypothetical protein Q5P01_018381 [Channa striata]
MHNNDDNQMMRSSVPDWEFHRPCSKHEELINSSFRDGHTLLLDPRDGRNPGRTLGAGSALTFIPACPPMSDRSHRRTAGS